MNSLVFIINDLLVLNAGDGNGLLGVAGMIFFLVMTGIIPENSLRLAPAR